MKTETTLALRIGLLAVLCAACSAWGQGSAFTYQGRLDHTGAPANGLYEMRFSLYGTAAGGSPVGVGPLAGNVTITNGLFSLTLDFGAAVFTGAPRWLEIAVRRAGSVEPLTVLSPRQELTPVPYATFAPTAGYAAQAGTVNNGLYSSSSYTNPAWIASLDAGKISGAIPDARLSANVARLDANQTFTGASSFGHPANRFTGTFVGDGSGLTGLSLRSSAPSAKDLGTIITRPLGNGTFSSIQPQIGSLALISITQGDFNHDGRPDIVAATIDKFATNSAVVVLTNSGSGNLARHGSVPLNGVPTCVTASDLNGDGRCDLACSLTNGTLIVLTNMGGGLLARASTLSVGNNPRAVLAVDLNNDGSTDLVSANQGSDTLTVLTNDSRRFQLSASSAPSVGREPVALASADFNGDGRPDLACANLLGNSLTVLINVGDGRFAPGATVPVGSLPRSLATADVNGDGFSDLICANSGGDTLSVMTNNGNASFGLFAAPRVGTSPSAVVAAEINGDGRVDLIATAGRVSGSQPGQNGSVAFLFNNGNGTFALKTQPASNPFVSMIDLDWNGDGPTDVVVAEEMMEPMNPLIILLGNANSSTGGRVNKGWITIKVDGVDRAIPYF